MQRRRRGIGVGQKLFEFGLAHVQPLHLRLHGRLIEAVFDCLDKRMDLPLDFGQLGAGSLVSYSSWRRATPLTH